MPEVSKQPSFVKLFQKIGHKVNLVLPNTGELDKNYFNFYNIKNKFKITRLNYFNKFPNGLNYYLYSFFSIFF